ncbi:hypothetical protein KL938_005226 [Ogataea parapolymorpha]|nr:hypothetical protein KL938_005226 [Ogataea parapolymorpha]
MTVAPKKRACDWCHASKQVCLGGNPCDRCVRNGWTCTNQRPAKKIGRPPKPMSDRPQKPRKYNKNGCLTCKQRKRKCENETWPCKLCLRLGLKCSGEAGTTASAEILLTKEIDSFNELKETEKMYMKYFVNDVAPILFAKNHAHVFLKQVVNLAFLYQQVRNPILGIAATHRSCKLDHELSSVRELNPAYRDSITYRARSKLSEYPQCSDEIELLSVLLSVMMEILVGDSLDWFQLLQRAYRILERCGGILSLTNDKDDQLKLISVQLFCYLDFVSSLSTCNPPYIEMQQMNQFETSYNISESLEEFDNEGLVDESLLPNTEINSRFVSSLLSDSDTSSILKIELGFKFGIAGDIFKIMGKISALASLRKLRGRDSKYDIEFDRFASEIEMKLQNWDVPEEINFENISDFQRTQYALALQWACFLRLHQIRYGYNRDDSRPKGCLVNILQAIESIPEGSQLESGLMVPLILAGSVASREDDRRVILKRMRNISGTLKFPYIQRFEMLLMRIWERDSLDGNFVNWAAVRYYEFPGLVMF